MPYKNREDRIKYYHRHQKHYDKQYINNNREAWNKYNAEYKKIQRQKIVPDIISLCKELNLGEEKELSFKAAVLAILINKHGFKKECNIAKKTGYSNTDVNTIIGNWRLNDMYTNDYVYIEEWETELEFIISITLTALVGSGEVKRVIIK